MFAMPDYGGKCLCLKRQKYKHRHGEWQAEKSI